MKKRNWLSAILTVVMLISMLTCFALPTVAATNGVQGRLDELKTVYYTDTYFTKSGNPAYDWGNPDDLSADSQIRNIPARGGLPSGASVGVTGTSCWAFAQYCFYYMFGHNFYTKVFQVAQPALGDVLYFWQNGNAVHYGIYLGEDNNNWYVYDANYWHPEYGKCCWVRYYGAVSKSNYSITAYRSNNYDSVYFDPNYSGFPVTIAYNANGGSGSMASHTVTFGSNFTLTKNAFTRTGHTFSGWNLQRSSDGYWFVGGVGWLPDAQIGVEGYTKSVYPDQMAENMNSGWTTISETLTFHAIWTPNTYTVSYDANGGSGAPSSYTTTYGETEIISSTIPTRSGYTFDGWATKLSGSSGVYHAGDSIWVGGDMTFYARWEPNTYTVSYNANGGSGAPSSQTKTYGQTLTLSSTVPTRSGYSFLGWSTSSSATSATYSAGGSFTTDANTTLYAVWKANTYTVSFDANGGSGAPSSQTKTHGQTLTLSSTKPTRSGYTFRGWSTSSGATTATYSAGGIFTSDANTTLYAIWELKTYSVYYNANGGSGAPSTQTGHYGQTLTLSSVIPTRSGYTFLGWSTDASATSATYIAGITYTQEFYADITLYAVWKKDTWEYIIDNSGVIITGYTGDPTELSIPSMIEENGVEYPVVAIGENAFNGADLISVTIPDGVTSIGAYAFKNCLDLTSITIPESVTTIGDHAFRATDLQSVTIPNSVTSIGIWAFYECGELTSVTIPAGVTNIGRGAFGKCYGLEKIDVEADNAVYCSVDGVLFNKEKTELLQCPAGRTGEYVIPNGVITVGASSFAGCVELLSVKIPYGVEIIGNSAFEFCTGLTQIDMPESVITIEEHAFSSSFGLTSVTIGDGVTAIGDYSFYQCTGLKSVTIGNSVTTIGDLAFYNCTSLTSVTIGDGVTAIGSSAFAYCKGLISVILGNGVTSIGYRAFGNCTSLPSVVIPKSVTSIGDYAFANGSALQTAYILNPAATIGNKAFPETTTILYELPYCTVTFLGMNGEVLETYTEVEPGASVEAPIAPEVDGYLFIGWDQDYSNIIEDMTITAMYVPNVYTVVFKGMNGTVLSTVEVEHGNAATAPAAPVIEGYTFVGWDQSFDNVISDLTITAIYEEVKEEWEYTVANGKATITKYNGDDVEVVVPAELGGYPVAVISSGAFQNNTAITGVTFPETLVQIGSFAFSGCKGLISLVIPESVTAIGRYAFNGCSALTSVLFQGANTTVGTSAIPAAATLHYWWSFTVADGTATITGYSGTATELKIPATVVAENVTYPVTQIGNAAFSQNTAITSAVVPEGVETIDLNAFYYCTNLVSVKFPSTLKNIYSAAFQGCTNLPAITFPEGLEYIGSVSFNSCRSLTKVTIPQSVTSIGRYAFWVCNKLETVTIYNSDITLGDSAFPTTTNVVYKEGIDTSVPHLKLDTSNTNLAILNTIDLTVSRVYWGYAGSEEIETQDWNTFASAVPSSSRVSDYNPTEGEVYAMVDSGYYLFWINYTDAEGNAQSTCQTVYAEGTLDENYGKPYLELDETGKVAWMNLNGTTVQKMYWGFIGDADYKYTTWDEFCTRVRNNSSYLPDYGVKDGEGYVVNETGYYRFVIVYLDAQGVRQERYFTIEATTPATAPFMDNSTLSNVVSFVNEEGYTSKVYYGYIGTENTKYVDFNTFKATATDFVTDFGTQAGKTFQLTKAGYWRFVINYTVNGASKDAICTVYVDEADLSLGTPKLTQSGNTVTLDANGSTVSKIYIGYMGTEAVEIDSWADYTANRQTNTVTYGPKDGTAFTLGTAAGYYTVVVSYNTGGADQLAFYTFQV